MNDADIHFPPGQRRDKPSFEPPPWERDQFDELSKRKAEEQAEFEVEQPVEPVAGEQESTAAETAGEHQGSERTETDAETDAEAAGESERPVVDAKQVEVLLMGLRAEEPRPEVTFQKITVIVGVVAALVGLAIATWGVIVLVTPAGSAPGAVFLASSLLLFGLGFMGIGAWVVYKSLRQQGVL